MSKKSRRAAERVIAQAVTVIQAHHHEAGASIKAAQLLAERGRFDQA